MKRRDLLKGLSILPFGIKALRQKPKEEPKPEPVKPPESQPRISVQIPDQQNLSVMTVHWSPQDMALGQDGWIVNGTFIPGK